MSGSAMFGKNLLRKICRVFHVNAYYKNEYGYKMIYGKKTLVGPDTAGKPVVNVPVSELYLGIDGLYDEYSHAGKAVKDSPHFGLIAASAKNDFTDCPYLEMEKTGKLDARDALTRSKERHLAAFRNSLKEFESGDYKPVVFYTVDGKKYLYDGKHRAALCACLGAAEVKGVEINPNEICSEYMLKLAKEIKKHPEKYQKQKSLIEAVTAEKQR